MSAPTWFLLLICSLEFCLMVAFAWHRQWQDVIYWLGVQLINVVLIMRAYEQLKH